MKRVKKENKEKIMEMIRKAGSEEYETSWNKAGVFSTSKKKSEIKKGKLSKGRGARFELKVRKDLESKGRVVDKWNNNVGMWDKEGNEIISKNINKSVKYILAKTKKEIKFGDIIFDKCIIAKRKYNPFKKMLVVGTGFPDFISIKHIHKGVYSVIGVEAKMNGILSKIEKQKCAWYLKNKIFSQIWIAKKGAPKGVPSSTKKKDLSDEGKKRGPPKGVHPRRAREPASRPRDISLEMSTKGKIEYDDFEEKYGKKYNKI